VSEDWRQSTWGAEISLEYGKAIRGYQHAVAPYRVFGSNGPIGWTESALAAGPGVILGRKGAYRGVQFSTEPFFVIDTAYFVKPKTELDMRWLYYAIIHHKLGEIDDGSPIPSTTRAAVYVRDVDVPSLPEQRAIAATLGALDDKIELNRRMNETLEAMARALFRDWFVDFGPTRAKMAGTTPYLSPDLWSLFPDRLDDEGKPEGWQEKPLDEIANFLNGLALQKFPGENEANSLPVIKIAELRNGITAKSNRASRKVPSQYVIQDSDFLFSWSGSLLAKFWTGGEGALNQHLFKVSSDRYPAWFFSEWVQHHLEEFQLIAASKATTMGHFSVGI
jgi:type I restriction enzyme S subunit